jgi:SAM-dependent methyltransferase
MPATATTSYDEIPYGNPSFAVTHPDRLAAVATLYGLRPAPVERCRVLELGCASGGNLLPLAELLPHSRFVGIDLSPGQVARGRAAIEALGLANVRLMPLDIAGVPEDFGAFDYIICHGLYSWVPADVRDKILAVCKRHLAPDGVAYVSYNTYPGWHLRAVFRDLLGFHVRPAAEPRERVARARAFVDFLDRAFPNPDSLYGQLLRREVANLKPATDAYLFHEHLEAVNEPCYFHQFVEKAAGHGLQYLDEAEASPMPPWLTEQVRETLTRLSSDPIRQEQYLDFLSGRTFRRTLLCHDHQPVNRDPPPALLARFHLTALAEPVVTGQPDLASDAPLDFRTAEGVILSTNHPLVKTALLALFGACPRSLSWDALLAEVRARLSGTPAARLLDGDGSGALAEGLLECFRSHLIGLHLFVPPLVLGLSERPVARPVARLRAAEADPWITNLLHRVVPLGDFDRLVLRFLDGRHDRAALTEELARLAAGGAFTAVWEGQPLHDPVRLRGLLGEWLEAALGRLARSALLIG